jgi:2-oxoglutarate ferredoxin oxidoreductase subunit delta
MSDEFNRKGYHIPEVINAEDCLNCKLCDMICPDFAIFSTLLPEDSASTKLGDNGMHLESAHSISLPMSDVA